ncbi:MAG: single-stranded DNA-binding protein [Pirellulaceae bacterium]|nr:single-stranded DNA-binding protein [Pirellulaceae bacterium]
MSSKTKSGLGRVGRAVLEAAQELRDGVDELDFGDGVPWIYNPLQYAWSAHEQYIRRYAMESCQVLFVGMNPGPWGMAQTGVPFGQVAAAHNWLGIDGVIGKPPREHPLRPIEGWSCRRSEVSGERLWGLFKARYGTPEAFFAKHYVANYCPLVFMAESARNVTPDKLPVAARGPLERLCDQHLAQLIKALAPKWVVGVGAWAEGCAKRVATEGVNIGKILHPSPASPAANRDWAGTATKQLQELSIW